MKYGLIICAGKQSRFKSDLPKALASVGGKPLLQYNIAAMGDFCDKIFVVCSKEKEDYFTPDILGKATRISIESGKGSGDAVWQALNQIKIEKGDLCIVQWGDCLQQRTVYQQLVNNFKGVSLIPCVVEQNPYVKISKNLENGLKIEFSKFGEVKGMGYHDLSVFYCDAFELKEHLDEFRNAILDQYGNYVHKHGNEMEFLDVFNETSINANILEIKQYKEFAFNTLEQLQEAIANFDFKSVE